MGNAIQFSLGKEEHIACSLKKKKKTKKSTLLDGEHIACWRQLDRH
jgi:hypothetical protein